jgi:hypothetical protein
MNVRRKRFLARVGMAPFGTVSNRETAGQLDVTYYSILVGLGAGFVSAIVFISAATGLSAMHVLLFLISPLVLFLAGFGAGPVAARIGALTATALIFTVGGTKVALVYAACPAVPALVLTHLASLNREWAGNIVWYPVGRIVLVTALLAAVLAVVALLSVGTDLDALHAAIRDATEVFVASRVPKISGAPALEPPDIDAIARDAVQLMPSLVALFAMACLLLNMWIAGRVTLASGRLQRPWPDLATISYPRITPLFLLLAIGLAATGGYIGLCAKAFVATLVLAYVLLTLAILHYITRGAPWRGFVLWAVYMAPLLLLIILAGTGFQISFWVIAVLLALPGLADSAWPIRKLPAS